MRKILIRLAVFVVGFSVGAAIANDTPKYLFKVIRFNTGHVGVYCTNGAYPAGKMLNGVILEVSCVDERTGK